MIAHVSTFQRNLFFAQNIQYLNKYLRCERGKTLTPAKQIRRLLKHVKAIFHGEKPSTSLGVCCIGSMFIGGTCCSDLNHRNHPQEHGPMEVCHYFHLLTPVFKNHNNKNDQSHSHCLLCMDHCFFFFSCLASLVVERHAKFTIFPKDFSLSRRDLLRGASATELKKCFRNAEDAEV